MIPRGTTRRLLPPFEASIVGTMMPPSILAPVIIPDTVVEPRGDRGDRGPLMVAIPLARVTSLRGDMAALPVDPRTCVVTPSSPWVPLSVMSTVVMRSGRSSRSGRTVATTKDVPLVFACGVVLLLALVSTDRGVMANTGVLASDDDDSGTTTVGDARALLVCAVVAGLNNGWMGVTGVSC